VERQAGAEALPHRPLHGVVGALADRTPRGKRGELRAPHHPGTLIAAGDAGHYGSGAVERGPCGGAQIAIVAVGLSGREVGPASRVASGIVSDDLRRTESTGSSLREHVLEERNRRNVAWLANRVALRRIREQILRHRGSGFEVCLTRLGI